MPRVTITYPNGEGVTFDMDYYLNNHMKLFAERMAGAYERFEVYEGKRDFGGADEPQVLAQLHVYVDDLGALGARMQEVGGELMGDVPNYTNAQPTMTVEEEVASG